MHLFSDISNSIFTLSILNASQDTEKVLEGKIFRQRLPGGETFYMKVKKICGKLNTVKACYRFMTSLTVSDKIVCVCRRKTFLQGFFVREQFHQVEKGLNTSYNLLKFDILTSVSKMLYMN